MTRAEELDEDEPETWLEQPSLALGFLACLPLILAYEIGVAAGGAGAGRNACELFLGRVLLPFGEAAHFVRWTLLGVAALFAWHTATREKPFWPRSVARLALQGVLAALLLGPILVVLMSLFESPALLPELPSGPAGAPSLDRALRLFGAAFWEELLFRVGAYGLVFLLVVRLAGFFGVRRGDAGVIADLAALLGSSLLFAAFHLEVFSRFLGPGGERHDAAVFLWRLLAGLLLAALFRWRGLGVSAWAHGVFNVGLFLGAGPGVFIEGS